MKHQKSIFILEEVSAKGWRYPCRREQKQTQYGYTKK